MSEVKKLVIATPFYEVKAYSPYITSLLNTIRTLTEMGIEWDYYELSGDSYVDRAKNSLINRFLEDEDATHIMMIDSDMAWDVMGFGRILKDAMADFEVVGAGYPCKNNWEFFGCIPNYANGDILGTEVEVENGEPLRLLDMFCIPGGFICYSRAALEATIPNLKVYEDKITNQEFVEFFKCNIEEGGGRVGEDVYFQQRYKEVGGKVWLEPNVNIQHYGIKAWEGNYHEFLLNGQQAHEVAE